MWKGTATVALVTICIFYHPVLPSSTGSCGSYASLKGKSPENESPLLLLNILLGISGGSDESHPDKKNNVEPNQEQEEEASEPPTAANTASSKETVHKEQPPVKKRHASSVISSMSDHGISEESYELRRLIASRAHEFMEDLATDEPQKPKKLLHYVASRIPAIKHSPDSMLKITSARPDVDAGVAACCIGTVARACEQYEKATRQQTQDEILSDRRFEQLVECVLCGVDVKKRKKQAARQKKNEVEKSRSREQSLTSDSEDESVFDEQQEEDDDDEFRDEDAQMDKGVSVRDACRAAWGIALLGGGHASESISGTKTMDLLLALSLRTRELLLARLHMMREAPKTRQELEQVSRFLARDAACAMWTFACVDACTGQKSYPLFAVCCSILCQSPQTHYDLDGGFDDSKNFEVDDVVDRLAKSEDVASKSGNVTATDGDSNNNAMTDGVLLDSLSPNEIIDILWALALHGIADDSSSKDGHSLPETAGALREVAFDRLVAWLRHDLAVVTSRARSGINTELVPADSDDSVLGRVGEMTTSASTTTVEVVDAATLLAMAEDAPTATIAAATEEHMTMSFSNERQDTRIDNVQVVDAATLLSSSGEPDVEREMVDAPKDPFITLDAIPNEQTSLDELNAKTVADADTDMQGRNESIADQEERHRINEDASASFPGPSESLLFSPHDLCSIAWAVTDLRDPLRFLIVDLVTEIFAGMGPSSTTDLLGFDKSNLVWAIARCSKASQTAADNVESIPPVMVSQWMAECALIHLRLQDVWDMQDDEIAERLPRVLDIFQPPELSRLLWSMACVTNAHGGPRYREQRIGNAMSKLAFVAMCTAESNLSVFATEDLARIAWAFLELCDSGMLSSRTLVAKALGSITATMEASLLRWESGQCSSASFEEKLKANESIRFTTFFGRPRLSRFIRPLLEQRLGEYEDDEDESDTFSVTETATLPLLRDLTVDPSTLCKVASGFCRLAQEHRDIEGAWTVVRVAVRLLTAKNGQLLRECSIHDIVRLCNSCATNQVHGEDRELIMRMLARRVVQLLNESFEEQKRVNTTVAPLLTKSPPWELSILYWSLGELGVRHGVTDENSRLAHRKLRLVTEKPLLSSDQLESLPLPSLAQLLHGMVSMNAISYDKLFLQNILSLMLAKVETVPTGDTLCQISVSVARIRRSIGPLGPAQSAEVGIVLPMATQEPEVDTENARDLVSATDESVIDNLVDKENSTSVDSKVFDLCNQLLTAVAEQAVPNVADFTAAEMRQLLLIYSVLPFQADGMVDSIEVEVTRRLSALDLATSMSDDSSIQKLVRLAADNSVEAGNVLSNLGGGETEESSLDSIKSGIKSLFASSDKGDETPPQAPQSKLVGLSDLVNRAAASACEAVARIERVGRGAGVKAETIFRGVEAGAAFELGRCQELIASYRRIDFDTGTRQSRYDKERRKEIAKRVLSRLFP